MASGRQPKVGCLARLVRGVFAILVALFVLSAVGLAVGGCTRSDAFEEQAQESLSMATDAAEAKAEDELEHEDEPEAAPEVAEAEPEAAPEVAEAEPEAEPEPVSDTYSIPEPTPEPVVDTYTAPDPEPITGTLTVHFIDVGQGDATFLELPDGTTMLIDAGPSSKATTVTSYIKGLGYSRIDYLVATHPDADHIGGMEAVIAAFDIGELWAPYASNNTLTFEGFLDAVANKGLSITTAYSELLVVDELGLTAEVLSPAQGATSDDTNDLSIVLLVTFGSNTFLFTGDAPATRQLAVASAVDVLKVAHHGGANGMSTALAAKLSPRIAVISYSLSNSYGHPTQGTLDALAAVEARVYGTGANGTVIVISDGTNISVSVTREGTVVSPSAEDDEEEVPVVSATTDSGSDSSSGADTGSTEKLVYITPSGKKYHKKTCSKIKNSTLTELTEDEAIARGYEACKVCGG